ncbi:HD domain-containing protein [Desulfopila sp. IMCC35006]|uniref:deoxyguanosinetriphosphate triphosphohydrolase family protein n=1 Tax=Desulfopila sp. IMCC35006 TaxID=2569542 RepID=UPI0010ACB14B|nr:HD domain-containing protein [Desulfopila sp. IMCC35006]TKB25291.1 HD domain-containing protein [Desulfopila sp. IMCC35006]
MKNTKPLLNELARLDREEAQRLASVATKSPEGRRRFPEETAAYRQHFALDADRILYSRAYSRYIDKTQVFSLVANDHITHRVLHVQLVARIARTIGRFLRLNEDLIEAISLGHDVGHPPFGHDGEKFLSDLCLEHGLPPFQHNIQSVRLLDRLERKGRGWNLTLQVLNGILCHDGEVHSRNLHPEPMATFAEFDQKLEDKSQYPERATMPATLEGCVVRLADTIAYIGRDMEDAIILGLIRREDLPEKCRTILGNTNGTIVYTLVTDLITHSHLGDTAESSSIGFSEEVAATLQELKAFNYERIYLAPSTKQQNPLVHDCYRRLFDHYLACLDGSTGNLCGDVDLMTDISPHYLQHYSSEEKVRDFIAGMTDDFFLKEARLIGCRVPEKK